MKLLQRLDCPLSMSSSGGGGGGSILKAPTPKKSLGQYLAKIISLSRPIWKQIYQ